MSTTKCPKCKRLLKERPSRLGGYILVSAPWHSSAQANGYMYEHRLVAEELIGRSLIEGEVVHHKIGVKTDNRPKNLLVMTVSEHRKYHNFMRWHGNTHAH